MDPQSAGDQARGRGCPTSGCRTPEISSLVAYLDSLQLSDGHDRRSPTASAERHVDRLERIWAERPGLLGWLTTTDHKRIGILYFFTSLAFFGAGGVEALLIRTQLIGPNGPSALARRPTTRCSRCTGSR